MIKSEIKTTLHIFHSQAEMKKDLATYQSDILVDMFSDFKSQRIGADPRRLAADFGAVCLQRGVEFDKLSENTPWIETPTTLAEWIDYVRNFPYLFGITDDLVTKEVSEVKLHLENEMIYDISELISKI